MAVTHLEPQCCLRTQFGSADAGGCNSLVLTHHWQRSRDHSLNWRHPSQSYSPSNLPLTSDSVTHALVLILALSASTKTSTTPCSLISRSNQKYGRVLLDDILFHPYEDAFGLRQQSVTHPPAESTSHAAEPSPPFRRRHEVFFLLPPHQSSPSK